MELPEKMIEAHEVVHVGVADEDGADRLHLSFGQVVKRPAIE